MHQLRFQQTYSITVRIFSHLLQQSRHYRHAAFSPGGNSNMPEYIAVVTQIFCFIDMRILDIQGPPSLSLKADKGYISELYFAHRDLYVHQLITY